MAPREIGGLFASVFRNFGPKRKFLWRGLAAPPTVSASATSTRKYLQAGILMDAGDCDADARHVLPADFDVRSASDGGNGQLNLFLLNFPSPQGARTGKGAEKRRNRCRFTLAAVLFCGFMRRKCEALPARRNRRPHTGAQRGCKHRLRSDEKGCGGRKRGVAERM